MVRTRIALVLAAALVGCGGTGTYVDGEYRGDTSFHVESPPAPFRRISVEDSNDLAFADDDGVVIQVNGSCDPALDIPLVALTNHLLIGFTEREYVGEPELRTLDGREALHTHVLAKLDGVPRELYFVVTKKNECVYDLSLIAPPGPRFEAARVTFDRMVAGFSSGGRR